MQITLNEFGDYLGANGNEFLIYRKKKLIKKVAFHKVNQIILSPANLCSTNALCMSSIYGIDIVMTTNTGKPLGAIMPLSCYASAKTRIAQYEALKNSKAVVVAKRILRAKIRNQFELLKKHGVVDRNLIGLNLRLEKINGKKIEKCRTRLQVIEAQSSRCYFRDILPLFPKDFQTRSRTKYKALDPLNNLFNLGYEVLKGEVFKAVMYAHLDPYIGFLHSPQFGKPSLVCDLQELFRWVIDDFLIGYTQKLTPESFEDKNRRIFLKRTETYKFVKEINKLFDKRIEHQRIKKFGKYSKIRTAIREESIKLAQYIRGEKRDYEPIVISNSGNVI